MRQTPLLAAFLVALTAACSESPAPGPSDSSTLNLDVATIAAAGVAEDVTVMAGMNGTPGPIGLFDGQALFSPPTDPGNVEGCEFGGTSWTCERTRINGVDVTRVITFFDAGGAAQEHFDNQLTASIDVTALVEGDVTVGPWTGSVNRERHLIWTGLAGTETTRTINGNGTEEVSRSRFTENGETRGYDLVGSFTLVNIVMPVRGEGIDPWPLSGTATRTYTVTRLNGESVTRTVVVTFDGTSTPDATVNGEAFELDLALRRAHRRP